jgi:glycosyltransferase involved in cell wall biosynthesis
VVEEPAETGPWFTQELAFRGVPTVFDKPQVDQLTKSTDIVILWNTDKIDTYTRHGKKVVVILHTAFTEWGSTFCKYQIIPSLAKMPKVICVSKIAYRAARHYQIPEDKLVVIENGFSESKVTPLYPEMCARERIGIGPDEFVFGYSGRITEDKKFWMACELAKQLKCRAVIVGDGWGGSGNLGILKRKYPESVFPGWISNPCHYYLTMSLGILASISESWSYMAAEMLMMGKPMVMCSTGMAEYRPELFTICDTRTPEAFIEATQKQHKTFDVKSLFGRQAFGNRWKLLGTL